ncbi:MAG: YbjN domain-containing protein [Fimbriimonadaceae bacterium]|nr:YbjN domain-containing protein [Fimbriimonadaceae bacterium]
MRNSLLALALLVGLSVAPASSTTALVTANLQAGLVEAYDIDLVTEMLEDMDYDVEVGDDDVSLIYSYGDWTINVLVYDADLERVDDPDDGTVFMFQANQPKLDVRTTKVNEWNKGNYFGRLYLNNDDDHVYLEYDVELEGGISEDNLMRLIERFEETMDKAEYGLWPR